MRLLRAADCLPLLLVAFLCATCAAGPTLPGVWTAVASSSSDPYSFDFRRPARPVAAAERAALVAFYHAAGGPGWRRSTRWLLGDPCLHKWYGVQCSALSDGTPTVVALSLWRNNLAGRLVPFVDHERHAAELRARSDALVLLARVVPAAVVRECVRPFVAGLPPPTALPNLEELDLSDNALAGPIPSEFALLKSLRTLSLAYNALDSELPASLGDLPHLQDLFVQHNKLVGAIPASLARLRRLWFLDVSFNEFSSAFPDLSGLHNLVEVGVAGNSFARPLPRWLVARYMPVF